MTEFTHRLEAAQRAVTNVIAIHDDTIAEYVAHLEYELERAGQHCWACGAPSKFRTVDR